MIHLFDTPVELTAMMGSVNLPGAARAAPPRPAVCVTHKDILAVEALETWTVGIVVGTSIVSFACFEITLCFLALAFALLVPLSLFNSSLSERCDSRVVLYFEEDAEV